jgi:transitional endoplasmic reticulum ATPase
MSTTASESGTITLQVAGARSNDVGKGIARMPREHLKRLGIGEGGIIEIAGKRTTAAVAVPPYDEDEGLNIIRLDGLQRANANVSIGDNVAVGEADVKPASRVIVAPAQQNVQLAGSGDALMQTLYHRPLVAGDVVSTSVYRREPNMQGGAFPSDIFRSFFEQRTYGLFEMRLIVVSTKPQGIVQVTEDTEIEIRPQYQEPEEPRKIDVTYDDIGGVGDTVEQVREMIELPLKHPELFQRLGIDPPKGILLHGPPGTGKTLLARAVANEADANIQTINGPEIMGKYYGESEERLRKIFEDAQKEAPSIIFIDEVDSIAPKRGNVSGEVERRVVAQLLTLLDGLEARENVIVIAATNRVDDVDEALRRPGRFDREIVIDVPDYRGRREIMDIHTRGMPLADDVNLEELSHTTFGFVGADIASLSREAAIESLRRNLPEINLDQDPIPQEALQKLEVTQRDFLNALRRIQPSALREVMIQAPDVEWDDIGGLQEVKQLLHEGIELPIKNPDSFRRLGIRPPKGFLFFGPPGTGKTLLAKAVAKRSEANFISAKSSSLLSKWYGESEKQISQLFHRARQVSPSVILIDEIDSLAPQRGGGMGDVSVTERVVNSLLAEMDGLEELQGVVVVGVTNRPMLLDRALLRPGRFDELIYVPIPDKEGRKRILEIHTAEMPLADDVDLDSLAERTERYTGADLENLVRRAGLHGLRMSTDTAEVPMSFFEEALKESHPSVTQETLEYYKRTAEELKQERPERGRIGFTAARE